MKKKLVIIPLFLLFLVFSSKKISASPPSHFLKGISFAFRGYCSNNPVGWSDIYLRDQDINLFKEQGADFVILHITGPAGWFEIAKENPYQNGSSPENWNNFYYDFRYLDSAVIKLLTAGITPVLNIWGTPIWANGINYDRPGNASPGCFDFMDHGPVPPNNLNDYGYFMKALAERYSGRHPQANPLDYKEEEFITIGGQYWRRISDDRGITWPENWETGSLVSLWGNTTSNDPNYPHPPLERIDVHHFRPYGDQIAEAVEANGRYWFRTSADGKNWPSVWWTDTLASAWVDAYSDNPSYPRPDPGKPVDSHSFAAFLWLENPSQINLVMEVVVQQDRYWLRYSHDKGLTWDKKWSLVGSLSEWSSQTDHPPVTGVDIQDYRLKGDRLGETVIKGSEFWYRESLRPNHDWPNKWYHSLLSPYYQGIKAPPTTNGFDTRAINTYPSHLFLSSPKIDNFMPWAEANYPPYWAGTIEQFVTMSNFAYDQIKTSNPSAIIWGGNMASCGSNVLNLSCQDLNLQPLDWLKRVSELGYKMDKIGIRSYPTDWTKSPSQTTNEVGNFTMIDLYRLFQVMAMIPAYKDLPIIVGESGYRLDVPGAITEQQQADFLQENFNLASAYFPWVEGWTNFLLYEYPNWDTGFIASDLRRRPGFYTFRDFAFNNSALNLKKILFDYNSGRPNYDFNGDNKTSVLDFMKMVRVSR